MSDFYSKVSFHRKENDQPDHLFCVLALYKRTSTLLLGMIVRRHFLKSINVVFSIFSSYLHFDSFKLLTLLCDKHLTWWITCLILLGRWSWPISHLSLRTSAASLKSCPSSCLLVEFLIHERALGESQEKGQRCCCLGLKNSTFGMQISCINRDKLKK